MRSKQATSAGTFLLAIVILSLKAMAQIGPVTAFDGVLDQSFNRYVTFSGTSGLQYERDILEKVEEYTISTWIKFDQLPWETGNDMVLFDFYPGFYCKLMTTRTLTCKPQSQEN